MGHGGRNRRINYPAPRCALLITLGEEMIFCVSHIR